MTLHWRDYSKAAGKGAYYEHHGGAVATDVIHLNRKSLDKPGKYVSSELRRHVSAHELRHALGLCHKSENVASLMWAPPVTLPITEPIDTDKASYRLQDALGRPLTRTRFLLTALDATIVCATAGTGYSDTTRDDATAVHSVCLPEDNTDRNKVGNGGRPRSSLWSGRSSTARRSPTSKAASSFRRDCD
ncbi:hypothetical protein GCM10010433_27030 [Streptomyces pulveraceus]|uniref:Peptidase M10 metallopeptidase domain-containing protein n=1 Tax=Streptomyces pulveraceus TaxID=68258 RepID=A0ABW1GL87_9ACTN